MIRQEQQRPAIAIEGLRKRFGPKEVLRGLDLRVEPGCVFAYIGPNGAGKTTTVRILMGLLDGFEGTARVAGADVRSDVRELKRRVGYVPENAKVYEGLTAFEHLQLVGRLRDLDDVFIEATALELLDVFGLRDRAHMRLGAFSKGMTQKVMIASAMLHDPEVLFLDEPLAGLDVSSTIFVKDLIRSLADGGKTVFYCSHMMDVVERVADRIVIIDDGRLVADGTFEELRSAATKSSLEDVFQTLTRGEDADARVERFLRAVRKREKA